MSIELRGLIAAMTAGLTAVGICFAISFFLAKPVISSGNGQGAPGSTVAVDPADLQAEVISGGQHFVTSCSGCHGAEGVGGGAAPNLHNEDLSDAQIFATISNGKGPMPAFAGIYNAHQINSLVAYVRSLH
jgi:mono/diheme cytochrome c family protein